MAPEDISSQSQHLSTEWELPPGIMLHDMPQFISREGDYPGLAKWVQGNPIGFKCRQLSPLVAGGGIQSDSEPRRDSMPCCQPEGG